MEFSYRLTDTGWAQARLVDGEIQVELPASYRSDAPTELLVALRTIQEGAESAHCSWEAEPGEYRWLFFHDGDRLRLTVLSFLSSDPRRPDSDGRVEFECDSPIAEMERAFTAAFREVLDVWGEEGYLAEWVQHRFPKELLELVESQIGITSAS